MSRFIRENNFPHCFESSTYSTFLRFVNDAFQLVDAFFLFNYLNDRIGGFAGSKAMVRFHREQTLQKTLSESAQKHILRSCGSREHAKWVNSCSAV